MHFLSLIIFFAWALPVLSSPIRRTYPKLPDTSATNSGNAYSGAGGSAKGGSITSDNAGVSLLGLLGGDGSLLNLGSKNAGSGGDADSGPTRSYVGGGDDWSHGGSQDKDCSTSNLVNSANSYSGQGGNADGGGIDSVGGLVNLWSVNGGDAGSASSGSSGALIPL